MWVYKLGKFEVTTLHELVRVVIGTTVLGALSYAPTGPRMQTTMAWMARRLLRLQENVTGLSRIDPDETYIVTPLHESFADALLLAHLPLDLRFVARDELFDWPQLGRFLDKTGQIKVRPENRIAGFRSLLTAVATATGAGQSVVMFPQGSILGVEAAFHRGAFRIAGRLGLPVLPVVISGTHRVWEHPHSDRLRFGQPVSMMVLDPIPVGDGEAQLSALQRRMKQVALTNDTAPVRRFDPDVDGYWDDYSYDIDKDFPETFEKVSIHRASAGSRA